jgi:hypothetical protein
LACLQIKRCPGSAAAPAGLLLKIFQIAFWQGPHSQRPSTVDTRGSKKHNPGASRIP